MNKIVTNVDFADSNYQSCKTINNDLIIDLRSWDDQILRITFINAIKFIYLGGSYIEGIYEKDNENSFIKEALACYYENVPIDHPFKNYVILDIEDNFFFEVVAEKVLVDKQIKIPKDSKTMEKGYPCPCCGYLTLLAPPPGTYEICPVCYWKDDEDQFKHSDFQGGANLESLNEARQNYMKFGTSSLRHLNKVRVPREDEFP